MRDIREIASLESANVKFGSRGVSYRKGESQLKYDIMLLSLCIRFEHQG